ncbi:hypothetical protein GCM10028862_12780 [Luteimonas pelagia]
MSAARRGPGRWLAQVAVALAFALAAACAVQAQERILRYDSEVDIRAGGGLDVTEHITVRAEGNQIRRGIYRDFPTRYRDRFGNRVSAGFEMVEVLRDGRPEPWFTERRGNGVRINTGDDGFLDVPAEYTYTLRYRTTHQLGFFEDHDELYWNAIGTGWAFPVEAGTVVARLPEPVPVDRLSAEGYTGRQGARGQAYTAELPAPGTARWTLTGPLAPGEGFTVVLTFPKGVVTAPTAVEETARLLSDNLGVLVALGALALLLAYCIRTWRKVGRDPAPGTVIVRYDPPEGHSPAGLRYMKRMGHDTRAVSADLLALAVAGHVDIDRDKGLLKDRWTLQRRPGAGVADDPAQRALFAGLFAGGDTLELDDANARTLQATRQAHASGLARRYQPEMFRLNGGKVGIAVAIAVAGAVLAGVTSGGHGVPLILAVGGLMLLTVIVFGFAVRAPTPEGRRLLDTIEGFRRYLGVAERDELARMAGPDAEPVLDAARYEALLPYAVALEVEDAWTRHFTEAVGVEAAQAATRGIGWYHGTRFDSLGQLAGAVGKTMDARIASASTPPGSSSGSGGGGFSGGGGGGGGGGGR